MREGTMFKKAYELSTLCDIEVCILYYGRDGELIKTWPEDKAKVRDMAKRFSQLSDIEKRKKSSNLSEFLSKKMSDQKKHDFNKFTQKLMEMEYSLERRIPILQDHLRLLISDCGGIPPKTLVNSSTSVVEDHSPQQWTEPSTNPLSELPILQDQLLFLSPHEEVSSDCGIPQPLMNSSASLVDDPPHQQWTEPLVNLSWMPLLNDQSKFSIVLYNHENSNFTQLASSFDQSFSSTDLLGAQGFGGCNNNNIVDLPPPLMHTSFDQSAFPFSNLMSGTGLIGAQGFDGCNTNFVDLPPPLMMQTFPSSSYY